MEAVMSSWPVSCRFSPIQDVLNYIRQTDSTKLKAICEGGASAIFYAVQRETDDEGMAVLEALQEKDSVEWTHLDRIRQTALFYAARDNKLQCCGYLIDHGVDATHKDIYGQTPLFYACREGHVNVAKLLISHGCDPNNVDLLKGETPLFYCAVRGQNEMANFLIGEAKCTVMVHNVEGKTAAAVARRAGHVSTANLIESFAKKAKMTFPIGDYSEKKCNASGSSLKLDANNTDSRISSYDDEIICTSVTRDRKRYRIKMQGTLTHEWIHPTRLKLEEFELRYPEIAVWSKEAELPIVKPSCDPFKARWCKLATEIMKDLWKYEGSEHFKTPVDVNRWNIQHYLDIVKNPMDFGTIKKKLANNEYHAIDNFLSDVNLVFENCLTFNGRSSVFGLLALNLQSFFKNLATRTGFDLLALEEKELDHDALRAIEQLQEKRISLSASLQQETSVIQTDKNNKTDETTQNMENKDFHLNNINPSILESNQDSYTTAASTTTEQPAAQATI